MPRKPAAFVGHGHRRSSLVERMSRSKYRQLTPLVSWRELPLVLEFCTVLEPWTVKVSVAVNPGEERRNTSCGRGLRKLPARRACEKLHPAVALSPSVSLSFVPAETDSLCSGSQPR